MSHSIDIPKPKSGDNIQKYHDFECCETPRGIDTLLAQYRQDREEITTLMLKDPNTLINTIWKQEGPLAIDSECRCRMGKGERRSTFACAQCKNMRRLIDFRLGAIDRPFEIKCGQCMGKNLIVSNTEVITPFLSWDDDSARRAQQYIKQYDGLTMCGTPFIPDLKCITGDPFTIRTLIMWMIAKRFTAKGLPHIPMLHTAFICGCMAYSLYEMPNIGTMPDLHKIESYHNLDTGVKSMKSQHFAYTPLKSEITRTIIIQLLVTLIELSKINFSHGTPSIHGLVFNKNPVSYMYDGIHVNGPVTLQISDLWNSSATFGSTHFFPKSIKSSMHVEKNMFIPEIATRTVSMAPCHDPTQASEQALPANLCEPRAATLYRLTNSTIDIYNAMRHIGFPLYVGSFDFYCFMVSLMCDKSFFDSVVHDKNLYRLWSMMWLAEDLPRVEEMIKEAHEVEVRCEPWQIPTRSNNNIAVDIVRGSWLRCDIVQYIWSLVKMM